MPQIRRRDIVRAIAATVPLSLMGASGFRAGAAELIPFRVGEASPANTFLAIWMAEAAGFYEAQGLKLEIVHMVGGRESGPDLSSGRIHLMHIGMSSVVRANLAGGAAARHRLAQQHHPRHHVRRTPVKTNAELKGGTFGISSAGSESDSATTLTLRRLGLAREDVTVKEIGTDRLTPLRNGAVAATVLGEPQRSQAIGLGMRIVRRSLCRDTFRGSTAA